MSPAGLDYGKAPSTTPGRFCLRRSGSAPAERARSAPSAPEVDIQSSRVPAAGVDARQDAQPPGRPAKTSDLKHEVHFVALPLALLRVPMPIS